jgi:hypothetical protein
MPGQGKWRIERVDADEKPRIKRVHHKGALAHFSYRCDGCGSTGYGYTPGHAYRQWEKNHTRRQRFYAERRRQAEAALEWGVRLKRYHAQRDREVQPGEIPPIEE